MSDAMLYREIERLRLDLARLTVRVPLRSGPAGGSTAAARFLQIIGGQTITTGQEGILYAGSLSLSQIYDPDVDTSYPNGLGNAWLWSNGVRAVNRVLVRHDMSDNQLPLLAGRRVRVLTTETLTVASGPDAGATMTAYTVTWE